MTNNAPKSVNNFGISLQIKKPNTIAKTKLRYFIGVTNDASANLQLWVSNKFATLPHKPIIIKIPKSIMFGKTQSPLKIVAIPNNEQSNVK